MNRPYLALFLVSALLAPATAQGQKMDLKVQAKKGDAAAFVAKQVMSQSIDLGGQQMEMGQNMTHDMVLKIADVAADGTLSVEVNLKRIQGSFELPMMGSVEFDTNPPADGKAPKDEEEDEDPMGGMGMPSAAKLRKAFAALIGKSFTATVDAHGKVQKVDGVEEAMQEAKGKSGGGMMAGNMLSSDSIKQMVEQAFAQTPKDAKAVGDSWDGDVAQEKGRTVPVTRKTTLTLAKCDAESMEITVSGTVEAQKTDAKKPGEKKKDEGEEDEEAQARKMMSDAKIENGKIQGKVAVSRKDGFVLKSEVKMSMDITAESPMGGEMKIAVTATNSIERAKPGEAKTAVTPAKVEVKKDEPKAAPAEAGKTGGK